MGTLHGLMARESIKYTMAIANVGAFGVGGPCELASNAAQHGEGAGIKCLRILP